MMSSGGPVQQQPHHLTEEEAVTAAYQQMQGAYVQFQQQMQHLHQRNQELERVIKERLTQERIAQIYNALKQLPS